MGPDPASAIWEILLGRKMVFGVVEGQGQGKAVVSSF